MSKYHFAGNHMNWLKFNYIYAHHWRDVGTLRDVRSQCHFQAAWPPFRCCHYNYEMSLDDSLSCTVRISHLTITTHFKSIIDN